MGKAIFVLVTTFICLTLLGMALKWSVGAGQAWWIWPLAIAGVIYGWYLIWTPADTADAKARWADIKRRFSGQ